MIISLFFLGLNLIIGVLFWEQIIFGQILKVENKSFQMMYHLSYLDIKHEIYLEGEEGYNKLTPPPRVLIFK